MIRGLGALLLLIAAVLACALPVATQQPLNQTATGVAQTLQALAQASPKASPAAAETQAPTPSPGLLPHSMYFLNKDDKGLLQISRLARDGQNVQQITFEPADVGNFDVSPKDGSVAYISNNQMYLVDANGAGRRLLVDGGAVTDATHLTNSVGVPVWSPDGGTIAFSHGGLNFYTLSTGAINKALENRIDTTAGFAIVGELYAPDAYSPDGSKLLINISFEEGGTFGIYHPADNTLVKFNRPDGQNVCCDVRWIPDGSALYAASPTMGMMDSGLWSIDASSGLVTTLLPGSAPDGTYNFAFAPELGPDGKLYFFFNNLPQILTSGRTPLFLVRAGSDGLTGRTQLQPGPLQNINEVLWAPDANLAVVASVIMSAATPEAVEGSRAEIIYPDGRPSVALTPFVQQMKWGP